MHVWISLRASNAAASARAVNVDPIPGVGAWLPVFDTVDSITRDVIGPTPMQSPKPNAVNALFGNTANRPQTVLSPKVVLDAVRVVFGGSIAFDPCYAEGSLTEPDNHLLVPWERIHARIRELVNDTSEADIVLAILAGRMKAGSASTQARNDVKRIVATIASEFRENSGHAVTWPNRTYANPVYGDKGPECILAGFADFCAAYAAAETECAMLCPVRSHRKWWRRDVLAASDAIVYLDPVKFEGFDQTFPAPLCLAYKGPNVDRVTDAFAHLGDTFASQYVRRWTAAQIDTIVAAMHCPY